MEENNIVEWNPNNMLEVTLNEPDDFLKIKTNGSYVQNIILETVQSKKKVCTNYVHLKKKYYIYYRMPNGSGPL